MKIDNRDREIVAAWLPGAEITTPEGNLGTFEPLLTRSSAIAVIADRIACSSTIG